MTLNLDRMRRYPLRTMPRPQAEWHATRDDLEREGEAARRWQMGHDDPLTPLWQWRRKVEDYCGANGMQPSFTVASAPDGGKTLGWKPKEDA